MTETMVATTETSSGVMIKPQLPERDGKENMLIAMRNLWKTYDMGAEKVHALHGVIIVERGRTTKSTKNQFFK